MVSDEEHSICDTNSHNRRLPVREYLNTTMNFVKRAHIQETLKMKYTKQVV